MPRTPSSVPTYRYHKASGQAFVEIQGQRRYLGKRDDEESRERCAAGERHHVPLLRRSSAVVKCLSLLALRQAVAHGDE